MVDFVQNNFVCKFTKSSQLVTHDPRNNSHHYKHTTILELAPICRDDLVLLPPKCAKEIGGIGPIVLVYKVTTSVHIVDIHTMRTHEIDQTKYWRYTFLACAGRERLTEFVVLNLEDLDQADFSVSRATIKQKMKMVQVEVCRKEEYGTIDCQVFIVQTHLGEHLNFFDTVLGYDILNMQLGALDDYVNTH
jgi:nonsense-mediated mRNA decay protein 3